MSRRNINGHYFEEQWLTKAPKNHDPETLQEINSLMEQYKNERIIM
jgi:hypothetical protein